MFENSFQINDMKELLFLRDLKLVDMTLEGNPFISRTPEFSDHNRLVRYEWPFVRCHLNLLRKHLAFLYSSMIHL